MPTTATPREIDVLDPIGRCDGDVVSCVPPPEEVGDVWAISAHARDVIQGADSPPSQEFACSCVANATELGDALDLGPSDALDEPAHSEARPVHRGNTFLVVLDPNELVLRIEGKAVTLTRTQFSILSYLISNEGRWVTTGELIREVLGTHHQPDTSLVRVHVHAIRRRLGVRAPWLESDRRRARGYRWRQFALECDVEPTRESSS
jgi:hypothetical protein